MKLENRRKLVQVLLQKSQKSLAAASLLAKDGFSEAAISRAYYAVFYLAQAALATKDISRSKHSGVIAAFGEHLTKKRLLPETLHKTFVSLYESRVTSDIVSRPPHPLVKQKRFSKPPGNLPNQ